MVNINFKNGFEKVAVSTGLLRSAYKKALKESSRLSKESVPDFQKIKKLNEQASLFAKGLDENLKKEIPKKKKIGLSSNVKSIVSAKERGALSSLDLKKLVG